MNKDVKTLTLTPSQSSTQSGNIVLDSSALIGSPIMIKTSGEALTFHPSTSFAVRPTSDTSKSTTITVKSSSSSEYVTVHIGYTPSTRRISITVPKTTNDFGGSITFKIVSDLKYEGFLFNSDKSKLNVKTKVFISKHSITVGDTATATIVLQPVIEDDAIPVVISDYSIGTLAGNQLNIRKMYFNELGNIEISLSNETGEDIVIPDETDSAAYYYPYYVTAFCVY